MSLSGRDIIKRAERLLGALTSGDDPEAPELNDAFGSLKSMLRGLHGTVIGPRLASQPFTVSAQAENGGLYQCALSGAATLTAPLQPKGGSRFGAVDVNANFSSNNLTVARNGQLLEGAASNVTMSTNGQAKVWFFDTDTGNWVLEADLATVDTVPPYPDRLLAYLPPMFAVFLAAEYGGEPPRPEVLGTAEMGIKAFARNYGRRGRNQLDAPFGMAVTPQQG